MGVKCPRRRSLVALMSAGLLQPLLAFAQHSPGKRRIGFMWAGSKEAWGGDRGIANFEKLMEDLGFSMGKDLIIDWHFANDRHEDLDRIALQLVRQRVDVIVSPSTPAVLAAKRATREIPIVFINITDPVGLGVVSNLARPGENITGTTVLDHELVVKRLEFLRQTLKKMSRIAYLSIAENPAHAISSKRLEVEANKLGISVLRVDLRPPYDLEPAFLSMKRERIDAVFVGLDSLLQGERLGEVAALALKHRVPSIGPVPSFAGFGGLVSYSGDGGESFRLASSSVAKILRGAKAGDLAVSQSTRFVLVVNLKTARLLGLTIPQDILARADRVIE